MDSEGFPVAMAALGGAEWVVDPVATLEIVAQALMEVQVVKAAMAVTVPRV